MIKLVACDLDGTLLNSHMAVSAENAAAIQAAQNHGIEFLVATGRSPIESRRLLQRAHLQTGFINLNGGLVFDTQGHLLIKHGIARPKALQIIHYLQQGHFYFEVITTKNVYTESLAVRIANVAQWLATVNPNLRFKKAVAIAAGNKTITNIKQVSSFDALLAHQQPEVMKFVAFSRKGQQGFASILEKLKALGGLAITSSGVNNIEINDQKAQKGLALLAYAKLKGISPSETAAIGDNINDRSMIQAAGVGVAMGNAVPQIKALAQITTKTNNNNGVAFILNQFMHEQGKK